MKPRNIVPAIVSLVIVGALIAGVAAIGTQPTEASVDADIQEDPPRILGSSADGQVEEIHVGVTGTVSWENLDSNAEAVRVRLLIPDVPGGTSDVTTETFSDVEASQSGEYEFSELSGPVIENSDYTQEDFSVAEDGATESQRFTAAIEVHVLTEDGEQSAGSDTQQFEIEVTNEEDQSEPASADTDGEFTASLDMQSDD